MTIKKQLDSFGKFENIDNVDETDGFKLSFADLGLSQKQQINKTFS